MLICGTLPSDLEEPIARGEGLHNEFACLTVDMVQSKVLEDLVHTIVKVDLEAAEAPPLRAMGVELLASLTRVVRACC